MIDPSLDMKAPELLEVRWDTADDMGWDLEIHVNDGGPLLVAFIPRELIDAAAPTATGDMLAKALSIRERVERAIRSAYDEGRFGFVYEAGSRFSMHRALTVTALDFSG